MPALTDFLTPSDLGKVAPLQVFARRVVEGFCTGLHRSPHKGFSVEFKQHRQYVAGDEIRHLDWKVYGKSDRFFIREYEEETNLCATLLLDCSGSMSYGGASAAGGLTKHAYAARLAACLAYLMIQQQDSVGLITFDDRVRACVPPRSRPRHLRALIGEMERSAPGGESELGKVFEEICPKLRRRGLVVAVSDCFSDVGALIASLAHLRHARQDVILFHVLDPDEVEFPFKKWTRFECLEVDGSRQMVDPAHLRKAYLENLERFREALAEGCGRHRIDLVPLTTDRPFADALAEYLALRRRR